MSFFDIILLIVLFSFFLRGFALGLIRMIGSLLGIIVGAYIASHYYLKFFGLFSGLFADLQNIGKVISFLLLFIASSLAVAIIFLILDKAYGLFSIIPFTKTINRLAGALLGLLVGTLAMGLLVYVINKYALPNTLFGGWLIDSKIAPTLLIISKMLLPLLAMSLKSLKSLI